MSGETKIGFVEGKASLGSDLNGINFSVSHCVKSTWEHLGTPTNREKALSTWGHPQTGSYLAQFEAVFFGTFFASSANRC